MKPILQHEQRLQKYANTHPPRMRFELCHHRSETFSALSFCCLLLPGAWAKVPAGPGAFEPGSRFVDAQATAIQFFAIEVGDRVGGFDVVRHLDEGETSGPAGLTIADHVDAADLAEGLE